MKPKLLLAISLLGIFVLLFSCGGKDKKPAKETTTKSSTNSDDRMVPAIDTTALKDETGILDAIQKVVDARILDEKKRKENTDYAGHFVELMKLHTAVLKASTAYSRSLGDPSKAIEFGKKFNAIEDKLYAK
jgi:hypothetical protein